MRLKYIVKGNVRGLISTHRKFSAAVKSLLKDNKECSELGGGAYSDANISVLVDEFEYGLPIIIAPDYELWESGDSFGMVAYLGSWDTVANPPSPEIQKVIEKNI